MSWLDLTDTKEGGKFSVLPEGMYLVQVQEAAVKATKAGTGEYLAVKFEIVGPGEGKGRVLFHNFNLKNPNAKAVEIGLESLKNFCLSAGMKTFKLTGPRDLDGQSALARVGIKNSAEYGEQNEISYFMPYDPKATANGAAKPAASKSSGEEIPF